MASFPAPEQRFKVLVETTGYVDIHTAFYEANGDVCVRFRISTRHDSGAIAHLFMHSRPEPRTFTSIKSLSALLRRWGFKAAPPPTGSSVRRCYVEKIHLLHGAVRQPGNSGERPRTAHRHLGAG